VPWVTPQPMAHVQPVQLVRALGGGPSPHTMGLHHMHRTAPPRPAHASRSVPIAGGEIEVTLLCAGGAGHAAGCGRGSLCALCPPRPFGCVPGQLRTSPNRPAHALRSASIAGGEIELALLCAEGQGMLPTPGRACRERCARRAARVPSWTEPCPCVSLCRRVVDLHERVRTSTLAPTLTRASTLTLPPLTP